MLHWSTPARHPGVTFVDSMHFPLYYSFTEGELFVVAWDASYSDTIQDSTMMDWVHRALESEIARNARFRVVLGHLPLYGVAEGRNRPGEVLHGADSLRRMLENYRVHTYISGHHHAYYPGQRGDVQLLYSGALGQGPRRLIGNEIPSLQTVTLLDFHFAADSVAYTTYGFENGELRIIHTTDLPPAIRGFNGYVIRRDLPTDGKTSQSPTSSWIERSHMRNKRTTIALSTGLGLVTGMRSMAGLAFISRHFSRHSIAARRLGSVSSLLRSKRISTLMTTLAASEMAADKLPVMPDRTQPASLLGRAAFGAFAGMAVAEYRGGARTSAALAGGLAAVGSAILFYHLRGWAADRINMPDWVVALVEDGLVLTAGRRLAAELDE